MGGSVTAYQSKTASVRARAIGTSTPDGPGRSETAAPASFFKRIYTVTLSPGSGSAGERNSAVSSLNIEAIRCCRSSIDFLPETGLRVLLSARRGTAAGSGRFCSDSNKNAGAIQVPRRQKCLQFAGNAV